MAEDAERRGWSASRIASIQATVKATKCTKAIALVTEWVYIYRYLEQIIGCPLYSSLM